MVKMRAIEPVNSHKPGEYFEVSEREAEQLERKGLAEKAAPQHRNKMADASENKANPSKAAGEGTTSSASRAGRASNSQTAKSPARGAASEKTDTR